MVVATRREALSDDARRAALAPAPGAVQFLADASQLEQLARERYAIISATKQSCGARKAAGGQAGREEMTTTVGLDSRIDALGCVGG